jgi:hypothetical protein
MKIEKKLFFSFLLFDRSFFGSARDVNDAVTLAM